MKKSAIILLVFLIPLSVCFSQQETTNKTTVIEFSDTVDIDENYLLIVQLPSKSVKTNSRYEGGFLVSYFIPADTAVFSLYSGHLPTEPFVSGKNCIVIDSIRVEPVFFERTGFCIQSDEKYKNKKGFFREKEYILLSYSAKYEWVDASKKDRYNQIFSDIELIEKNGTAK